MRSSIQNMMQAPAFQTQGTPQKGGGQQSAVMPGGDRRPSNPNSDRRGIAQGYRGQGPNLFSGQVPRLQIQGRPAAQPYMPPAEGQMRTQVQPFMPLQQQPAAPQRQQMQEAIRQLNEQRMLSQQQGQPQQMFQMQGNPYQQQMQQMIQQMMQRRMMPRQNMMGMGGYPDLQMMMRQRMMRGR